MKFSDFVPKIHVAYKGKASSKAPTVGSPKYEVYMSVTNDKLKSWAKDPDYNWDSLFVDTQDTVGESVSLPDDFIRESDYIYLTTESGQEIKLSKVRVSQRRTSTKGFAIVGNDPKTITFTPDVLRDYDGALIEFGYYEMPPKITTANSTIICDSFEWLAFAVAAELARNDPAKDDQFGNLTGLASTEYTRMAKAAKKISVGTSTKIPTSYPRMGRSW